MRREIVDHELELVHERLAQHQVLGPHVALVVRQEVAQAEMLGDVRVLVLRRYFDESLGILVGVGPRPPPLTRPVADAVVADRPAILRGERNQGDERERAPHDVLGGVEHTGPVFGNCIAEESLENREREQARRAEQPETELAASTEQRVRSDRADRVGQRTPGRRGRVRKRIRDERGRDARDERGNCYRDQRIACDRAPSRRPQVLLVYQLPSLATRLAAPQQHRLTALRAGLVSRLALYKEPPRFRAEERVTLLIL